MIGNKHVGLLRIEELQPFYLHSHAAPAQPTTRAEERHRINEVVLVHQPRDYQYRRTENTEQRAREKHRPPIVQPPHKTARPRCARLLGHSFLDCSSLFHQFL